MVILHIANVRDRPQSGVAVVVPKHVIFQSKYADAALLNLDGFSPEGANKDYRLFHYGKDLKISDLPDAFSTPDLVVFHEVYWFQYIRIYRELLSRKIPYVIVPHVSLTDVAQKTKRVKKILGNLLFFNKFIKYSEAVQFLSGSEREQTLRLSNKRNFVRSNGMVTKGRLKTEFNKDKLNLIYVGRFAYCVKGIDRILELARLLKENDIYSVHITLAGSDHDGGKNLITSQIRLYDIGSLVTVKDALFGQDKIDEILKNDCFIQLSRTEGQPLGVMEAMEIGMPCIVTEGTTFHEIAATNNAGIPVSDEPGEIFDVIVGLIGERERLSEISKNSSDFIHEKFDWDYVSKGTVEKYATLLDKYSL